MDVALWLAHALRATLALTRGIRAVVLNSVASTGEMNTLLPGSGDDAQPLKAPPPAAAAR